MTTHTSGAADLPEALDAIADSQYLAGVAAGWNAAQANDPNAALRKIHESRAGYLKPLRDAQLAAIAAGQAVAPAEHRNTKTHELLSLMIGVILGFKEKIGYSENSPVARAVAEAVEHLKDWPYPEGIATRPAPPAMDGGEDADGFFLLLPPRPKPEAPANTVGLTWDAYTGAQML